MLNLFILQIIAMVLTAALIPKLKITSILGAAGIVIALSVVNATIWDAALFFKIPDGLTQHALTILAANGVIFLVLTKILPGIETEGFTPAFVAPIVFSVSHLFIYHYGKDVNWIDVGKSTITIVQDLRDSLLEQPQAAPAYREGELQLDPTDETRLSEILTPSDKEGGLQ